MYIAKAIHAKFLVAKFQVKKVFWSCFTWSCFLLMRACVKDKRNKHCKHKAHKHTRVKRSQNFKKSMPICCFCNVRCSLLKENRQLRSSAIGIGGES